MLNVVCTSGGAANQCKDTNAACLEEPLSSGTYKCSCKSDFFANNAGVCTESKYKSFQIRLYCQHSI